MLKPTYLGLPVAAPAAEQALFLALALAVAQVALAELCPAARNCLPGFELVAAVAAAAVAGRMSCPVLGCSARSADRPAPPLDSATAGLPER